LHDYPYLGTHDAPASIRSAHASGGARFFLEWILAHPAVTSVIPATRDPGHMADTLAAAGGPLPDEPQRRWRAGHWAAR